MDKNGQNKVLYIVIIILVWIIVAWGLYLYSQKDNLNIVNNKTEKNTKVEISDEIEDTNDEVVEYTPMVEEAWKIGLDKEKIQECIDENKFLNKINSQMKVWADNFGITWTPGNVLINNETWEYVVISGAHPKESFIKNIDDLLSEKSTEEVINSNKNFVENLDDNTFMVISDKRDLNNSSEKIISELKKIENIKNMNVEKYDFSDKLVKEYLEENEITALPLIVFTKADLDKWMNEFLVKLNDKAYSLNIGSTFNPFQELSEKWFKVIDLEILKQIKSSSYVDWDKNSKITWLEYSDVECPYCAKLHNSDVEPTLKAKYGDDLNIIFNHFPLWFHKKAIPWANILECVAEQWGDEGFYAILKYAFKNRIQE